MILNKNKATDVKIAYIGGGSRGWAWGLMSDLAAQEELSGTVYLYDIDYEAATCNETIGNSIKGKDYARSTWDYKAVKSIEEALTTADFVIISILPGTFDEMESDVHAPEKYGIYQSVGDSVGPGGQFRAHRTIPMYVEIAENLKNTLQSRLEVAGVEIIESRISHLAYAQEIAQAMLRRQQAQAVIAARAKIVEGAVGMVQMALKALSEQNIVKLDEDKKATMVNNLMVALVSETSTQPVINTGTLYQ